MAYKEKVCKNCKNYYKENNIKKTPFIWEGANLYFLLTDRFNNGNPQNDINFKHY